MVRFSSVLRNIVAAASALVTASVFAAEGGTSFWLPGQFGSLAATPTAPGWSLPLIYYHATTDGEGDRVFPVAGSIVLGLEVEQDLLLAVPTYVFTTPVWGAQAAVSLAGLYGRATAEIDASLSGPNGNVLNGQDSGALTSIGDLYPQLSLRWNSGNHNALSYTMLGLPVGSYEVGRLVNIGTHHWAVDVGGGYTYLNSETGLEFSATAGLTYNFENPETDYQNGVDSHLEWGLSQFISEQMHIGLVGYFFYQLTGDSGSGATLGDFKSKANAIGPQLGYLFKMGGKDAYFNMKAYWEWGTEARVGGWNSWITLSIPITAGT